MRYQLPPAAKEVAESWLRTRADDPDDDGSDADAALWLAAIEQGECDLPAAAWRVIADDLEAEAETSSPDWGDDRAGRAYRTSLRTTARRIAMQLND